MDLFLHHIYEYKKGLRNLILHTAHLKWMSFIEKKLSNLEIDYLIDKVSETKINVFFGSKSCVDVLKAFPTIKLCRLTDEEDFILAAMLGYDVNMQCQRYIKRKSSHISLEKVH